MGKDKLLDIAPKAIGALLGIIGIITLWVVNAGEVTNEDGSFEHAEGAIVFLISLSQWMMYGAGIFIVGAGLYYVVTNIKQSVPVLIGVGAFVLILVLGYAMASDELLPIWLGEDPALNPTAEESKWAGAGLMATYILGAITIVGIVAGEVMKIFR